MTQRSPLILTPWRLSLTAEELLPGVAFVQTLWPGDAHLNPRLHRQTSVTRDWQASP